MDHINQFTRQQLINILGQIIAPAAPSEELSDSISILIKDKNRYMLRAEMLHDSRQTSWRIWSIDSFKIKHFRELT